MSVQKKRQKLKQVNINEAKKIFPKLKNANDKKSFFSQYKVSEQFIEKYADSLDRASWLEISDYQVLSETFIEKYKDKVSWLWISQSQELSETFMDKYQDFLRWDWISFNQKMSLSFIIKHLDKLNVSHLRQNEKLNQEELSEIQIDVLQKLAR